VEIGEELARRGRRAGLLLAARVEDVELVEQEHRPPPFGKVAVELG